MRSLIERHDWAATPLGPREQWPASLRAIVTMMLDSPKAMVIWWGEELCQIYNDACAPRLTSALRPNVLGRPAAQSWEHSWADIGPQVARVMAGLPSRAYEDFRIGIERDGAVEDTYWTYSFTPLRDDQDLIRGVLIISTETTERVLSRRRQQTLDALRQQLSHVKTAAEVSAAVALAASHNPLDLPGARIVSLQSAEAVATGPLQSLVPASAVGIDLDMAILFTRSPSMALDRDYRVFLEQLSLLVATAHHRIDAEAHRRTVESERDRLLLDAPVGAAVMIGPDLVYHLVNAIYAAVSGRPAEAMVGKPFIEVFPELQGSTVHEKFKEVYRSGEAFVSPPTLVQIHRHAGALDDRYFTYNLSPLRTLEGQVYGLMVIAVDITPEVESRAQVEHLNADLQAAASAKDEFLALLGHELRNPLAPIVTALELMRLRDRSSNREQVIIRRQVSHLTRLVDDLLDVSRITRGKVELRKENVEVSDVLMRAIDMASPVIEQRQQHLQLDIEPCRWYGDPARLAQIVSNLLTNASRYSHAGASIVLRAQCSASELTIAVSDNGSGLSEQLLPRIFEPFVQGERKLHASIGGLGIGLALVKNLSELHGGSVAARSPGIGRGSTFVVKLPLAAADQHPADPRAPQPGAAGAARSILIVDDNNDAADTLAELLRLHGHAVVTAYTVEDAQQQFEAAAIDLVILDIGLPGMSGYALAELLRGSRHNSAARYVALSGFGQDVDQERSMLAGFEAHFTKPLSPAALAGLVALQAGPAD